MIKKEEKRIVIAEYNKGKTMKQIAKERRHGSTTIAKILKSNNIKIVSDGRFTKGRQVREDIYSSKRLIEMYNNDIPISEMARFFNCCNLTIIRILNTYGLKPKPSSVVSKNKKKMPKRVNLPEDIVISMYKEKNIPYTQIAKHFKCSAYVIEKILLENNIEILPFSFYRKGKRAKNNLNLPYNKIIKLYKQNISVKDIASRFKCCTLSIYKILKKYEIPLNILNLPQDQIINLYKEDTSAKDIALKFNCGVNLIYKILHKHKTPLMNQLHKEYFDSVKKEINNLYINEDYSLKRLARKFNCSTSLITKILNKLGTKTRTLKQTRSKIIFPTKDTSIEVKVQNFLKDLNLNFATHQYMNQIQDSYQCDIFVPAFNLIIECDGDYWHGNPAKYPSPINKMQAEQIEEDKRRTQQLIAKGFNVIRLWERDINKMSLNDFKKIINYYPEIQQLKVDVDMPEFLKQVGEER